MHVHEHVIGLIAQVARGVHGTRQSDILVVDMTGAVGQAPIGQKDHANHEAGSVTSLREPRDECGPNLRILLRSIDVWGCQRGQDALGFGPDGVSSLDTPVIVSGRRDPVATRPWVEGAG